MPYINQEARKKFKGSVDVGPDPLTEGELNFLFTSIILTEFSKGTVSYQRINAMIGVLECCKLELYRRLAAPYEDKKIKENGDVY